MQERKKRQKKKFQNLTIRDDFMFAAVLADEEICRKVLSLALGTPVSHVEVVSERTVRYHPEFRGIRLDICAHCRNGTCFDVEMQRRRDDVPHRSRYYHSQMDMSLLKNGADYRKLPTGYVIFICCFDPVGDNRYRYLFTARCQENGKAADDGSYTVLLSTEGKNREEVPKELVKFLEFIKEDEPDHQKDYQDTLVRRMQQRIRQLKEDREMEGSYMRLEELLWEERRNGQRDGVRKGRRAGRSEALKDSIFLIWNRKGGLPAGTVRRIRKEKDPEVLLQWVYLSAQTDSPEDFCSRLEEK